jgi:hypothetical protein
MFGAKKRDTYSQGIVVSTNFFFAAVTYFGIQVIRFGEM